MTNIGVRLLNFSAAAGLKVGGSTFWHKNMHKWIWCIKSQVDCARGSFGSSIAAHTCSLEGTLANSNVILALVQIMILNLTTFLILVMTKIHFPITVNCRKNRKQIVDVCYEVALCSF